MFDDIPFRTNDVAFKIGGNNPIVADEREGLHHNLSPIAPVGQSLQIAGHAGGKNHLGQHLFLGPEPLSPENPAVFQHQIRRFSHVHHNPFRIIAFSTSQAFST